VKVAIDAWISASYVAGGYVFWPVNRADGVAGERLGEKVVWQMLQQHAWRSTRPESLPTTSAARARNSAGLREENWNRFKPGNHDPDRTHPAILRIHHYLQVNLYDAAERSGLERLD